MSILKIMINENLVNIKNQDNEWSVYSLTCNNTPNIIYIGITNEKFIITRLFRHFTESVSSSPQSNNIEKHLWIRQNWQYIEMKVLEHNIFDSELARLKESEYVFEYIKKNYKVLNKTYTPIRVYDELGNFYKDFPSHTAAAKEFNVLPSRIITCYSTQQRLFHKYIIRKYNPNIDKIEVKTNNISSMFDRPVLQYTLDGVLIKEWNNAHTVSAELNIDRSYLTKCLNGKCKTAKNFIFRYKDKAIYKVYMYNSNNDIIGEFKNIKECALYLINNNLSKGKLNTIAASVGQSIKKDIKYLGYVFKKEEAKNRT